MPDKKKVPVPQTTIGTTTSATRISSSLIFNAPVSPDDFLLPEVIEPKLVILKYEFEMYFLMRRMTGIPKYPPPVRNAMTESAAVHGRNLCNFFCGFDDPHDDIRLRDIFDIKNPCLSSLKKELTKAYDSTRSGVNPREAFNQLVVHMTVAREKGARGYDYEREFSAIDPILRRIRDEIVRPLLEEQTR
jgi:hypothetical protein